MVRKSHAMVAQKQPGRNACGLGLDLLFLFAAGRDYRGDGGPHSVDRYRFGWRSVLFGLLRFLVGFLLTFGHGVSPLGLEIFSGFELSS
jgi:hypothetical protein